MSSKTSDVNGKGHRSCLPSWLKLPLLAAVLLPFLAAASLAWSLTQLAKHDAGASESLSEARAWRSTTQLNQDECRRRFPEAAKLGDGCQCLQRIEPHRDVWELRHSGAPPPGRVTLGDAGERGVGLFAATHFKPGEEIGRAVARLVNCTDFSAMTDSGLHKILCDTHLYPSECNAEGQVDDSEDEEYMDKKAAGPAIFPEWLDFINHASSSEANTYHGPSIFDISASGSIEGQTWVLMARRTISAGEELTIDYFTGSYEFEALRNAFGLKPAVDPQSPASEDSLLTVSRSKVDS